MLKIAIIAFALFWIVGLLFGRRGKRIIRDVNHLIQCILWIVLVFAGFTGMSQARWLDEHAWLHAPVAALWFVAAYPLAGFVVRFVAAPPKR